MKKQIFIIIGAIIVLVLILIWAYLLVFGTPQTTDDIYTDLGLRGEEDGSLVVPPPEPTTEETPLVNVDGAKLRQLTTKSVAGFREIRTSSSSEPVLYYAEMGTGHLYSINLTSGQETRLSGTTIAQAYEADFSSDGTYAAVSSLGSTKSQSLFLGEINPGAGSLDEVWSEVVHDFSIGDSNELLYTILGNQNITGYSYNIQNDTKKSIFTIPFREATVVWGRTGTSSHYVYPKASYALSGFLYEVKNGTLSRLPVDGFGFSAIANNEIVLYSAQEGSEPKSYLYDRKTRATTTLETVLLPEKCYLPSTGSDFICGSESINLPYEFPDEWYKGNLSFKDILWSISAEDMTSTLLVDTFDTAREIDVVELEANDDGSALYFINKNDNTLWTYEI